MYLFPSSTYASTSMLLSHVQFVCPWLSTLTHTKNTSRVKTHIRVVLIEIVKCTSTAQGQKPWDNPSFSFIHFSLNGTRETTKASIKAKGRVSSPHPCVYICVSFFVQLFEMVNRVLISLSRGPQVRPTGAQTDSAVIVMFPQHTAYTCAQSYGIDCMVEHCTFNILWVSKLLCLRAVFDFFFQLTDGPSYWEMRFIFFNVQSILIVK